LSARQSVWTLYLDLVERPQREHPSWNTHCLLMKYGDIPPAGLARLQTLLGKPHLSNGLILKATTVGSDKTTALDH